MPRGTPSPKIKLTKTRVEKLSTTKKYGERFYDSELQGFGVKVFVSGRKSFFVDYGPKDNRRRMTVGVFGKLTVDQARKKARQVLGQVEGGDDPLDERDRVRKAMTFKEWVAEYLEMIEKTKRPASIGADKLYLKRAQARWGNHKLERLTADDVRRFFESQKDKGKTTANRALASVRACLSAAWRLDLIPENVALKVKPYPESPPRSKVLTDDEMSRLMEAVDKLTNPHVRAAFLMMIHTGCRRSEALNARWEDLDLTNLEAATWRIPRPKSGRPEVKPLTKHLAVTLNDLPQSGHYVIAGRYPTRPRADLKRWWKDISKEAELEGITMHDIRRTFGLEVSRAAGLHVASKLLGHSTVKVTERVYAPLQEKELRTAAESVRKGRKGKLLKFKRKQEKSRK